MTDKTPATSPELIISRTPVFLHKEDIERVLMDKLPGHIADISRGGQWPGCRIIEFCPMGVVKGLMPDMDDYITGKISLDGRRKMVPVEIMNKFFELFANYMLTAWAPTMHGTIVCMYTSILNTEDTQDMQEVSDQIRKAMNAKRAERKATAEEAEAKAKVETEELLRLGKQAKEYNIIEKNREYIDEIHKLRLEVKALKRKAGQ